MIHAMLESLAEERLLEGLTAEIPTDVFVLVVSEKHMFHISLCCLFPTDSWF